MNQRPTLAEVGALQAARYDLDATRETLEALLVLELASASASPHQAQQVVDVLRAGPLRDVAELLRELRDQPEVWRRYVRDDGPR